MTSILSAISGFFSKSLILGTLLPVVVFIVLSLIFLVPLFPPDLTILKPLEAMDTQWRVIAFTLIAVVLSGLLYNLNIQITRIYEGYPWLESRIGKYRTAHYLREYRKLFHQRQALDVLQEALMGVKESQEELSDPAAANPVLLRTAVINQLSSLGAFPRMTKKPNSEAWAELLAQVQGGRTYAYQNVPGKFPNRDDLILPTRLGNTIRSFEYYADREYGMDTIQLWPRLVAKIDKDYAASIDDAKVSFDFMLNSSFLTWILVFVMLAGGLRYGSPMVSPISLISWMVEIIVFAICAQSFYIWSISRAAAWGAMIKGSFDLYRRSLLEHLGYPSNPPTKQAERALWKTISLQMLIGDPPSKRFRDYVQTVSQDIPAFVRHTPSDLPLNITRGILPAKSGAVRAIAIVISVKNASNKRAENVIITDTLPAGFEYEWNSGEAFASFLDARGQLDRVKSIPVVGANPYDFNIGALDPEHEVVISYRTIQRVEK